MSKEQLNTKLDSLRVADRAKDAQFDAEAKAQHEQFLKDRKNRDLILLINCRPATVEDYEVWLAGYLSLGNLPTHVYDYVMPEEEFYIAMQDFELPALYGALSISIIVPDSIKVKYTDSHNNLYFMRGFTSIGFHNQLTFVPIYSDVKF